MARRSITLPDLGRGEVMGAAPGHPCPGCPPCPRCAPALSCLSLHHIALLCAPPQPCSDPTTVPILFHGSLPSMPQVLCPSHVSLCQVPAVPAYLMRWLRDGCWWEKDWDRPSPAWCRSTRSRTAGLLGLLLRDTGRASGGGLATLAVNCSFSFMCCDIWGQTGDAATPGQAPVRPQGPRSQMTSPRRGQPAAPGKPHGW